MAPILIEEFVRFLEDGRWHTFTDIKEKLNISEAELSRVIRFLQEFGFLNVDEEQRKAKLTSSFLQLPT